MARRPLYEVFAEHPGMYLALDRVTNEPIVVAETPEQLVAEIRRRGVTGIAVVRARRADEPMTEGFG